MTLLSLSKVEKRYPGVKALDGVDFQLREGEVHALLGENGAGKSTLVKVMTGALQGDGGSMTYLGQPLKLKSTADAQAVGISTVYQEVNLLPNLSVAQNLYLGREPKKFGLIDWKRINRQSREVLERFELDIDVTRPLASFSVAVQQLIAIARGVDMSAKVLVLDEPTASLDADECEQLFGVMRELKAKGIGIVFITHFLDQVYAVSDRITVLRNGQLVGEFDAATLSRRDLVGHMLGKELQAQTHGRGEREEKSLAEPLLELEEVAVRGSLQPTSLTVRRGEAVGLAGLLGSGRSEVCRTVFGVDRKTGGKLKLNSADQSFSQPAEAIARGLALCPEDRKTSGIVGPLSIRENIALALQARRGWWRPMNRAEQQQLADRFIRELQIATPDAEKPIEQLSGGNQQKVILARWLATNPQLLVLDEPTRGVDIGAHAEILKLIKKFCSEGMSLLVTSSELDELVAFSDRVAVMRDRRKVAEIEGDDISESNIMRAIAEA
ncbi:sugar ABC transporter ATP-binding protein [Microbulbifer bruguierae]|uniref:Sugar ABC transporter ATP-binding protein n=1 Tax=Microbulbifer bruguierae TaxID=3029061 RepID=A0ABY8NB89_9GAMM|nr:sugar ABC transporter ATP-binding protein [Microbulbifer bruguierae]WGL16063.1 sugar ABC transporter ATP-binding protein [Microbulbifer bruguierae]